MRSIYTGHNTLVNAHSPLMAMRDYGATIVGTLAGCANVGCTAAADYDAAKALAAQADTAVVFLGLHPGQCDHDDVHGACDNRDKLAREDEGFDRGNITLPGKQLELLQAVHSAARKVVVVLINGGPIDITWAKHNVPAIVEAFYPGQLGGDAVTRVLYGEVSPSGRLPVTFYDASVTAKRSISDMSLSGGGGITYQYYQGTPLWEFGFGLSYTNFTYEWAEAPPAEAATSSLLSSSPPQYAVKVTNAGGVASDHSVLAFLRRPGSAGAPSRELFDFQRTGPLAPKSAATVSLRVSPHVAADSDAAGKQAIRPGALEVRVGDLSATLTLTGAAVTTFDLPKLRSDAGFGR